MNPSSTGPLTGMNYMQNAMLKLGSYRIRDKLKFDRVERHGPIVILVGRRGTGKSFCLRDICWHFHKDIKKVWVMSGTENCSPFFAHFVPPNSIVNKYNPDLASRIVNDQYVRCMNFYEKVERKDPSANTEDCRIMWILDDCMYDDRWAKAELMKYVFTCGRHIKIFLIVTMQYPLGIPPALRSNIDAVFLMNDRGANLQKIYDTYASGVFDNFSEFKMIFSQVTQNRTCMVIDNNNTESNRLQDLVFYYKAQDRGPFRMGTPQDWQASVQGTGISNGSGGGGNAGSSNGKRKSFDSAEYQVGMNKRTKTNSGINIEVVRN